MKRFYIMVIMAAACLAAVAQTVRFNNETLNYKVMFKWGLVQKQAGRATLKLTDSKDKFVATLYARSEPWADHFIRYATLSYQQCLVQTCSRQNMNA